MQIVLLFVRPFFIMSCHFCMGQNVLQFEWYHTILPIHLHLNGATLVPFIVLYQSIEIMYHVSYNLIYYFYSIDTILFIS